MSAPTQEFVRDFAARFTGAWNACDPERVLELMDPEIVYDDSGWPTLMRGHDEVRPFMDYCWTAFPDLRFDVDQGPFLHPSEPAAMFTWRSSATFTGPLDPPGYAPTGQRAEFTGVDVHTYRDGRLIRLSVIFDAADFARQLGVLPAAGTRAEAVLTRLQRVQTRVTRRHR
ncbi:MAG TPA: nuclear transport factor 2 family protein [Pseudonocardia sp.]|jgi:steroid delta-isomerase-like uncharacterized protein|nr:nuclear transport factor 2 family protein [Pseudonocardia sp.]